MVRRHSHNVQFLLLLFAVGSLGSSNPHIQFDDALSQFGTTTESAVGAAGAGERAAYAHLCDALEDAQRHRDDIHIVQWTDPMLAVFHRQVPWACTSREAPSCDISDTFFGANFARACRTVGEVPCRPTELRARDLGMPQTIETICRDNYGLDFGCIVTNDVQDVVDAEGFLSADVVQFDGTNTRVWNQAVLPKQKCPSQRWAVHEFRPVGVYPFLAHGSDYMNTFDISIGYSSNWTIFSPDYPGPITTMYGARVLEKTASAPLAVIMSQCSTPNNRNSYVEELMKFIPVHSYGKCLHNTDWPPEALKHVNKYTQKQMVLQRYKFYLALENSQDKDYVSEKIYNAFQAGVVPVYWGAPNVADFVPAGSYIDLSDFASPQELAARLLFLAANDEEYQKYHAWRQLPPPESLLRLLHESRQHWQCQLCKHVHELKQSGELYRSGGSGHHGLGH